MDRLAGLGATLQSLANEAAALRTGPSAGGYLSMLGGMEPAAGGYLSVPGGMEPAVLEASSIAHDLVDTTLVTTVKDRLSETGQIIVDVANQYRDADEDRIGLDAVMARYSKATGAWHVPSVPK